MVGIQDGECSYNCISLSNALCGCNEHQLPNRRVDVVHWKGKHWRASCIFNIIMTGIEDSEYLFFEADEFNDVVRDCCGDGCLW